MEKFKLLVDLVVGIAWPLVVVILVIKFSGDLRLVIGGISKHFGKNRNFRAKLGSFEYESNLVSLKESDLVEIVNESSSEKRKILMKERTNQDIHLINLDITDFIRWVASIVLMMNLKNKL